MTTSFEAIPSQDASTATATQTALAAPAPAVQPRFRLGAR
jgi:hypothetical protein